MTNRRHWLSGIEERFHEPNSFREHLQVVRIDDSAGQNQRVEILVSKSWCRNSGAGLRCGEHPPKADRPIR
jgi:hypothetical protein